MQSNLGDIFWQADGLYRTWAGLQIKNGAKIFGAKNISVIKHRNDKKKRFREKSTLIRVAEDRLDKVKLAATENPSELPSAGERL